MSSPQPGLAQLKAALKAMSTSGDYGRIAKFNENSANDFVARLGIRPGSRVLDVACGTGNTTIPAARAGASVTGLDHAPNLLAQAKQRATDEKLEIQFEEGDAEDLPFPANSFDVVLSMFGAMFAPRPDLLASELLRVCKSGGLIAMANWTFESFIGKLFQVTTKFAPPPPGMPAPMLWGEESTVRQRLSSGTASLNLARQQFILKFPFSPKETMELYRQNSGPIQMALSRLDPDGGAALLTQLEALWVENNIATDGSTRVQTEYLEVKAIRA